MTAADMIAALDEALAQAGTTAILRRYPDKVNTPASQTDVSVLAAVRSFRADELAGDMDQTDRKAVISPTSLTAASWPIPIRKNDKLVLGGREINIEAIREVEVLGSLVRYELVLRG